MPDKKVEKRLADLGVMKKGIFVHRDGVEKFVNDFQEARDSCQVPVRIESLDRVYHEFLEVQSEIEQLDDEEQLNRHLSERADFEARYCTAKGFLLSKRSADANQAALNASFHHPPANQGTFHLRLPQIDLPKFNGDFSKWLSFRDTYTSMVHSNADISTVAKLQYLIQSLEGEARKPFESVDIEADNYGAVWDALLKRYDNRRFLKKQLFRSIYDFSSLKRESANELHELVDEFQRHVKALAKLGEPVEHWDTPLVNILSYKLDPATLRAWEEETSQQDDVKYTDLVEFLYQRVRILKSVATDLLQRSQPVQTKVAGNVVPPKKYTQSKVAANAAASDSRSNLPSCYACSGKHFLFQCQVFAKMPVSQRRELVSQRKICWNCFRSGHQARHCSSKFTCRICRDRHHTLLHDPFQSQSSCTPAIASNPTETAQDPPMLAIPGPSTSYQQVSMSVQSQASTVLLETVVLQVVDDNGHVFQARALLDSASMSHFMSKDLAKLLSNSQSKVDVSVAGIGQSHRKIKRAVTTTIQSRVASFSTKLQFLVIEHPTADLSTMYVQISSWNLPNVQLADPAFPIPNKIDLVIGGEAYWDLHTGKKIDLGPGLPYTIETYFGWTFCGSTSQDSSNSMVCTISSTDALLDATLQRFWEIETIPNQSVHSSTEKACEELYAATTTRDSTGRYVVRLPKTDNPDVFLGNSESIAERRFLSLERRLERDSSMKSSYHQFMEEYERLGHMIHLNEPVDNSIPHCYLPHHPVFKLSSTTTKTRVVFDAACKTASGYSLNDLLLVGPVVQDDLLSLIMRFCLYPIALNGDVEKMYRQMLLHKADRPYQRIKWRTDASQPIATYELQTVTYGTASAPYLATKTLQKLASDAAHLFPSAAKPVANDFYVDDFLSGADDVESAIRIRREVSAMLASAEIPMKKWASNSVEVLEDIPPEDRSIQPWHDLQDPQSVSTLGLIWEPITDIFRFKVQLPLPAAVLTKRRIMSYVAQIFDPLGLVGPAVTKAKLFMQCLWTLKSSDNERYDWDQPLPSKLQQEWKEFHSTSRNKAYGTCCYVRAQSAQEVSVKLLVSKSKVSPLAVRHTIARLELCAAHLSMQLYKKVASSLRVVPPAFFWSDSTTVIQWLRSSPGRWKTFVANRVSQIHSSTPIDKWNHVAGSDNPADDISRGLDPAELLNKARWWNGPSWLKSPPELWPIGALPTKETVEVSHECRKIPIVAMTAIQSTFHEDLFSKYSSFSKLRRMVAWWLRYLQALRERAIVRHSKAISPGIPKGSNEPSQLESFQEERNDLVVRTSVSKSSPLKWLKPYVDVFGLIRVGGRLDNADLSESTKHPIVLSGKHPLASMLAVHYHKTLLHAGPQLMLSTVRQKYWIFGGRNLIRRTYHQCITCFRSKPQLIRQTIADLPASRVTPTRPFSVCGVDYCGPFYVKSAIRKRGPTKVYVAIFICFSTRSVHIELVSDLTTAAFVAALRRLIARRGKVTELHSDNATTFKGSSHAMHRVYRMLKQNDVDRNQIFSWCANNEIRWRFIPPRAPHFGGLWEAAVKSAKTHLLKEIGNTSLAYEDMLTLLAQVEMCLNSRPLTPLSSEPSDLEALTPGHFLVGSNLQSVPEATFINIPENRLNHWEQTQRHLQRIWARWYPEYLQQLQSRAAQGCKSPSKIEIGRLVVVKDDCLPPAQWPLGRIVKVHPGKDGIVRVVTLKTSSSDNVVRPVARIALLPISSNHSDAHVEHN
ncbi:uncharacterized protein LOC129773372 [Toxorhynchites rutilus septentrionalis]|uniref:uncharacterized protein LOC129773372 n=1 Tax=Toxorhynchites rutilus septentrionalis TaxID=329112 RepID=UPI0024785BDE|nr:uncharacterized protein LOC129773372 [Toxorhynchites rutilus septentrionalis]